MSSRVLALLLALALPVGHAVATPGEKRHAKQGEPPLDAQQARDTPREDKRKRETVEDAAERRRRWERALRGSDREEAEAAIDEMHARQDKLACEVLCEFVRRPRNEELHERALLALGWRNNAAAAETLHGKHGAESGSARIASAACRALGAIGDVAERPFLLERVKGEDAEVAAGALAGVVALDGRWDGLPGLFDRASADLRERVRAEAARLLGSVALGDWRTRLRLLAADPAPEVRVAACGAFGERADERTAPLLLELQAEDPDESVRAAALAALVEIDAALDGR